MPIINNGLYTIIEENVSFLKRVIPELGLTDLFNKSCSTMNLEQMYGCMSFVAGVNYYHRYTHGRNLNKEEMMDILNSFLKENNS